jgi:hypothetical protein
VHPVGGVQLHVLADVAGGDGDVAPTGDELHAAAPLLRALVDAAEMRGLEDGREVGGLGGK